MSQEVSYPVSIRGELTEPSARGVVAPQVAAGNTTFHYSKF